MFELERVSFQFLSLYSIAVCFISSCAYIPGVPVTGNAMGKQAHCTKLGTMHAGNATVYSDTLHITVHYTYLGDHHTHDHTLAFV